LYREGSYEGALAEFRKAYQISPSYRVLYNIAQTQYALHDFVSAHRSLCNTWPKAEARSRRSSCPGRRNVGKARERIAELRISTNVTAPTFESTASAWGHRPFSGSSRSTWNAQGQRVQDRRPRGSPYGDVAGRESVKVELQIDESIVTSAARAPGAVSSSVPLIERTQPQAVSLIKTTQPPVTPGRTGLIVSLSTTAVLGVGTGVFGYLALNARRI